VQLARRELGEATHDEQAAVREPRLAQRRAGREEVADGRRLDERAERVCD
jgi:hypothetical protein